MPTYDEVARRAILGHRLIEDVRDLLVQRPQGEIWVVGDALYRELVRAGNPATPTTSQTSLEVLVEQEDDIRKSTSCLWHQSAGPQGTRRFVHKNETITFRILPTGMTITEWLRQQPLTIMLVAFSLRTNKIVTLPSFTHSVVERSVSIYSRETAEQAAKLADTSVVSWLCEQAHSLGIAVQA